MPGRKEKQLGAAWGLSATCSGWGRVRVPIVGDPDCCTGRCWGNAHSGCSTGTASRPCACWAPTSLQTSTGECDAPTLPFFPPFLHFHLSPRLYPPVPPSANPPSSFFLLLPQNPWPSCCDLMQFVGKILPGLCKSAQVPGKLRASAFTRYGIYPGSATAMGLIHLRSQIQCHLGKLLGSGGMSRSHGDGLQRRGCSWEREGKQDLVTKQCPGKACKSPQH